VINIVYQIKAVTIFILSKIHLVYIAYVLYYFLETILDEYKRIGIAYYQR